MIKDRKSNKIAFITCVNHDMVYEECLFFLRRLNVPDGMEIEWIPVYNATSMASGYNYAMKQSDAKYKVYLHQDVFLLNRDFISDCLSCFESDSKIGMLGVWGGQRRIASAGYVFQWNAGRTYACNGKAALALDAFIPQKPYCEVEAIDGMLMVTQEDVWWREDVFKDYDFYDISQSMEFKKNGYKVVIPSMDSYWCIHDCGYSRLTNYEKNRQLFCKEYSQMGYFYEKDEYFYVAGELEKKVQEIMGTIDALLRDEAYGQALSFAHELYTGSCMTTEIVLLNNLYEIYHLEQQTGGVSFFDHKHSYRELADAYFGAKCILRRLGNNLISPEGAMEYFAENHIPKMALKVIAIHSLLPSEVLFVRSVIK